MSSIVMSCSDREDCGGLPAAVSVGTVTRKRIPYMLQLSFTRKLSGDGGALRLISHASLFVVAVTPRIIEQIHMHGAAAVD